MSDISGVEAIFGKLRCSDCEYVVGSIYRLPGAPSTVTEVLDAYLSDNLKAGDKLILAGDFNLPDINWADFSIPSNEKNAIERLSYWTLLSTRN